MTGLSHYSALKRYPEYLRVSVQLPPWWSAKSCNKNMWQYIFSMTMLCRKKQENYHLDWYLYTSSYCISFSIQDPDCIYTWKVYFLNMKRMNVAVVPLIVCIYICAGAIGKGMIYVIHLAYLSLFWIDTHYLLLHLHKMVEGFYFHCSLSVCMCDSESVCLPVINIPAEWINQFGHGFC